MVFLFLLLPDGLNSSLNSEVKLDDDSIISAKQIKELQKRNALLEEENLILKKAIAIFTPHSQKD